MKEIKIQIAHKVVNDGGIVFIDIAICPEGGKIQNEIVFVGVDLPFSGIGDYEY